MKTKTIKTSKDRHSTLSEPKSKNDTFDEVINYEEFTDKRAKSYNDEIDNFENGNLDNAAKLTLKDLEKRISKLENS